MAYGRELADTAEDRFVLDESLAGAPLGLEAVEIRLDHGVDAGRRRLTGIKAGEDLVFQAQSAALRFFLVARFQGGAILITVTLIIGIPAAVAAVDAHKFPYQLKPVGLGPAFLFLGHRCPSPIE